MTRSTVCRCGHEKDLHVHYRPGTDCAACGCRRWGRDWLATLRSALKRSE